MCCYVHPCTTQEQTLYQRMFCYAHPCTTQEQTLYQRMCCCMIRTAVHIHCCVLGERGGWRAVERQNHPYQPRSGMLRHTTVILFFVFCFFVRCTLPRLWHSSACFLLYRCTAVVLLPTTHCGFVGCWKLFFCCVLCCITTVLRTAVDVLLLYGVATWMWIGSWACPWVRGFFSLCCFSPLYRPRAGILWRTTSTNKCTVHGSRGNGNSTHDRYIVKRQTVTKKKT